MRTWLIVSGSVLVLGLPGAAAAEEERAAADEPEAPACAPVTFRRFGRPEVASVCLLDGAGQPDPAAVDALRALAAPQGEGEGATADVPLNPELLQRLAALAAQFPERAFELVSGYRPSAQATSRHHSGDALDLRIEGVENTELSAFARTLEATGVGYYPNSTFVHIDVRPNAAYWVDRSGPSEPADYVKVAHGPELPLPATEPEPEPLNVPLPLPLPESESASEFDLDPELKLLCDRALAVMRLADPPG